MLDTLENLSERKRSLYVDSHCCFTMRELMESSIRFVNNVRNNDYPNIIEIKQIEANCKQLIKSISQFYEYYYCSDTKEIESKE